MENQNKYTYLQKENRIPKFGNFLTYISNSNYRRKKENNINSIYNNISTSLSSYEKNNDIYNCYTSRQSRDNNIINLNTKKENRNLSPCCCRLICNYYPHYHYIPICLYDDYYTKYSDSLNINDEEINQKKDDLLNEIKNLKKSLKKVKNELNTKTEKDATDLYIKKLEREISTLNIGNNLNEENKRIVNSVKKRGFGECNDIFNKSFEVLDSVLNQYKNPRGKEKGDLNYYYGRNPDYNNLSKYKINEIKNDNFEDTLKGSDQRSSNKIGNKEYPDDNKLNIFKYHEKYNNLNDENKIINE